MRANACRIPWPSSLLAAALESRTYLRYAHCPQHLHPGQYCHSVDCNIDAEFSDGGEEDCRCIFAFELRRSCFPLSVSGTMVLTVGQHVHECQAFSESPPLHGPPQPRAFLTVDAVPT